MRGMIAPRADEATANAPDWTATSSQDQPARCRARPAVCSQQAERHHPASSDEAEVEQCGGRRVGDRAAVEAEHDDRHQPGEADQPDVERGAGERVDLHRHRDLGEHRADERGALPDQQPPVRRRSPAAGCRRRAAQPAPVLTRLEPRHGAESLDAPSARPSTLPVAEPVVQPVAPALPELDRVRREPVAAPVRRGRDRAVARSARLDRGDGLVQARPGRRRPATAARPRRPAASRAAGWRSTPRSRRAVTRSPARAAAPGAPAAPRRTPPRRTGWRPDRGPSPSRSWCRTPSPARRSPCSSTVRTDGRPSASTVATCIAFGLDEPRARRPRGEPAAEQLAASAPAAVPSLEAGRGA